MLYPKNSRKILPLFGLLLFVLLSLIYSAAIPADFFPIDDKMLLDTPTFHSQFQWRTISSIFTPGTNADFYPVRDLSYLLDLSLFGFQPSSLRWVNIFYFSCTATALLYVFLLLDIELWLALAITSLWALHPYHAEMILWISARKDLLGILFALLSTAFFLRAQQKEQRPGLLALSAIAFLLCCLSKAAMSLLPILVFAAIVLKQIPKTKSNTLYTVVICLIGAASSFVCSWFYSQVNDMHTNLSIVERIPITITALGKMLAGLIYVGANQVEMDEWGEWAAQNRSYFYIGITIIVGFLAATGYSLRTRNRKMGFYLSAIALLYFALPCVLSAHRFAYSVRYFEPIVLVLILFLGQTLPSIKKVRTTILALACLASIFSFLESWNWENNVTASLHALALTPNSLTKRTALLRDLTNLGNHTDPELTKLRVESVQYLQANCEPIGKIESAQDRQLSCHSFFALGFQMSLWRKDFTTAHHYLEELQQSNFKQILSQRQLDRMDTELKLAEGNLNSEDALRWLVWKKHNLDAKNRLITLSALCLSGQELEAKQLLHNWRTNTVLDQVSLENFEEDVLAKNLKPKIIDCLN